MFEAIAWAEAMKPGRSPTYFTNELETEAWTEETVQRALWLELAKPAPDVFFAGVRGAAA